MNRLKKGERFGIVIGTAVIYCEVTGNPKKNNAVACRVINGNWMCSINLFAMTLKATQAGMHWVQYIEYFYRPMECEESALPLDYNEACDIILKKYQQQKEISAHIDKMNEDAAKEIEKMNRTAR